MHTAEYLATVEVMNELSVKGTGTMSINSKHGTQAAHFRNSGTPCLLFMGIHPALKRTAWTQQHGAHGKEAGLFLTG
ncbi:hypothetical protein DPF_2447 [Desulfoplanes formicivorans]|uniref:Uncharacterized protein n=1 Tax=Desulfoplanes formicivorans TaxID=1592317 RepID=A0A194AKZ6_9BACT|nr:hypothetical protein DPF_2447 [Desulfoplanes formicivorans]